MTRITAKNFDQMLHADVVRHDIEGKSVRSGFVRVVAQAIQFLFSIGATMLLARLLLPEAFGLRDMVLVVLVFVRSFQDFGLPAAVANREQIDHLSMSRVFWVNLWLSAGIALCMIAVSPVLAWWFQEDVLLAAMPIMAFSVFALSSSTQPKALLLRQMRHRELAMVETMALIVGVLTAVVLALLGFRHWALLWEIVVFNITTSAGIWLVCGWIPAGPRSSRQSSNLRDLFDYSSNLTAYRVIAHIGRNLDRVLVGRFGGATDMGLYGRAYQWSLFPLRQTYTPLLSVAVSGLSRVQDDGPRYRLYFKRGLLPMYAIIFPLLTFMFLDARNVVLFVLGDQWIEAIPLFRVLCFAALFESINRVTKWLYLSQGETKRQLRWGFVYTPLMILAVVLGARWGTLGVAWGFALGTAALTFPGLAHCLHSSHVTVGDFCEILWRPTVAILGAGFALFLLLPLLPRFNVLVNLLIDAPLFGTLYLLAWLVLPGGWSSMKQILQLLPAVRAKPAG